MEFFGRDIFRLGFGLMRLPKLSDGSIDIGQVREMADAFIKAGGNYFDTAYVYDGGASEKAFKAAVAARYPRDRYLLATKLNSGHGCPDADTAKQQLYTSLERTGAGYFDFYLLHAIRPENLVKYDEFGIWDFVREKKAEGLVKHWGFSFHSTPEKLRELLTKHPDADFVQLQINYADWENPSVCSRECYEIARSFGKPIVIMEPVKGGSLADLPKHVRPVFDAAFDQAQSPFESGTPSYYASWALRFAASLPGVMAVLSGMSNTAQMQDNLALMKDFRPLGEADYTVIRKAQEALKQDVSIKCTACRYCMDGCPESIPIPELFALWNSYRMTYMSPPAKMAYRKATEGKGGASDCVKCGACEAECPQSLPIRELLADCKKME